MCTVRSVVCLVFGLSVAVGTAVPTQGGEIAELYRKTIRKQDQTQEKQDQRFEQLMGEPRHGVTEIGMERTPCFGTCPAYSVIIKADGTFRYEGIAHVKRKGKHTGRISATEFNQLADFLVASGYAKLHPNYEVNVTDMPTTYTTAVIKKQRKVVKNYGDCGPVQLWALQAAIDGVLAHAEWNGAGNR